MKDKFLKLILLCINQDNTQIDHKTKNDLSMIFFAVQLNKQYLSNNQKTKIQITVERLKILGLLTSIIEYYYHLKARLDRDECCWYLIDHWFRKERKCDGQRKWVTSIDVIYGVMFIFVEVMLFM
ncbi:Hypothetical_protein [Hexamita inflata]|uniref:Hypothetical_protein n=1 Tax=Hexamita inflata TaxID=28002 RepID=A0AA86RVC7_9EUKA|nr:Hypothetical protein HINF_LOCUS60910 [Hexamita inflata]